MRFGFHVYIRLARSLMNRLLSFRLSLWLLFPVTLKANDLHVERLLPFSDAITYI